MAAAACAAAARSGRPELASQVGWSPRYLQRRLLAETGLTPKAAARVTRFDRARRICSARPSRPAQGRLATGRLTLVDVAAGCGYDDQAHLAREFRALAGCPPSAWLAEEFRNVQSGPGTEDGK